MILFEVSGQSEYGNLKDKEYIFSNLGSKAIIKFAEIHPLLTKITAVKICNREDIIPTIEPIKEK